jgi:hypothetical protein
VSLGAIEPPTVHEEVGGLLEDLWQDWIWARKIGGEICATRLEELGWTFAVLWKAPPPGADVDMSAWLTDAGIRDEVEVKYQRL